MNKWLRYEEPDRLKSCSQTFITIFITSQGLRGALGSLTSAFTGSSRLVKNVLPVEQVVHTLAASNAPSNVSPGDMFIAYPFLCKLIIS